MTTSELALNGSAPIPRLDPYAGGFADETPRVDALAIISCGYRGESAKDSNRPGLPKASRPADAAQIHLHDPLGRAPGLEAALEAGKYRQLLITFPLDDPRQFVIQRFTRYSSTRLEAYGDENTLTWIAPGKDGSAPQHQAYDAGSAEYERLVRTCKADTRIYFCLAEWGADGPEVIFPDGLGVYAIRTTSRHSVRSILGSLSYTARFTRGRIAGLPFVLSVDHREVAGPDGTKRIIPVWTITTKPPEGARLSSRTFRDIATSALREGASLTLPPPTQPGLDDFDVEGPADLDEPSEGELAQLERGGLCDYEHWIKTWHAMARGGQWTAGESERRRTYALDSDEGREAFVLHHTEGRTGSLAEYLQHATEDQAAALIAELGKAITTERRRANVAMYDKTLGKDEAS